MKRLLLAAAFTAFAFSALALPSIEAVQAEIAKGHHAQAEEMMREVVAARPDSARARYVYAEILAHDKRFALAAEEAAQARRLDPSLSFTQPEKFRAFSELLDREQGAGRRDSPLAPVPALAPVSVSALRSTPVLPAPGGVPGWLWAAGAALLAFGLWRSLAARPASPVGLPATGPAFSAAGTPAGWAANGPAAPSGLPTPAAPSGSGLLGTGLAVAGGLAAGMLAERMLEGRREPGLGAFSAPAASGWAPGLFDEPTPDSTAAHALEERPIDLGTGDGWGGGDGDSGAPPDNDGW